MTDRGITYRLSREAEPTPEGKRSVRQTRWGNTNGYVSGRFWITFGPTYAVGVEEQAQAWLEHREED